MPINMQYANVCKKRKITIEYANIQCCTFKQCIGWNIPHDFCLDSHPDLQSILADASYIKSEAICRF